MAERETLNARVTRIEANMAELSDMVKILMAAQIKTEEQFQETRRESAERERRVDERIEKLVSAIGEMMREQNGSGRRD